MATPHRSRKICVLGGSGFVGRTLVARLIHDGHDVLVPTRSRVRSRDLWVLPGVDLVAADVHDERVLGGLVRGRDAVVNLIGILNERGHDGAEFRRVHVDLVAKLVRACRAGRVRRVLHMSALKADAEHGPSQYLRTKGLAESTLKELAGDELDYTIFRPSTIFGEQDSFTNRFASLLRMLPVLPLPAPDARFAPVFVEDVASAFHAALEDAGTYGNTYELCGPDIYSLAEVVKLVRWTVRRKRLVVPLPGALGLIQAFVGDYLVPGKPISLDNFRSLSVASVCSQNGFASFGITPRSLADVLPTYLAGASRQGRLARLRQGARR
jgi:NADH dehydrogenase